MQKYYFIEKGQKKRHCHKLKNYTLSKEVRNSQTKGLSLDSYRHNGRSYGIGNIGTAGSSSSLIGNVVVPV